MRILWGFCFHITRRHLLCLIYNQELTWLVIKNSLKYGRDLSNLMETKSHALFVSLRYAYELKCLVGSADKRIIKFPSEKGD